MAEDRKHSSASCSRLISAHVQREEKKERKEEKKAVARNRGARKRHWCFTSFLAGLPQEFDAKTVRYCIYQREFCPETKREHFQGYIEFFDNRRIGQVKAVLGECHLEARRGSRTEARDYCRKPSGAIAGTLVEFGMWREEVTHKRKLVDMLRTDMTLQELIDHSPHLYVMYYRGLERLFGRRTKHKAEEFRVVVVEVLVGDTGTGKTKKATSGRDWFMLPCSDKLWFDGYDGEKTLIIDDFYGNIKYAFLLRILDGHSMQVAVKGGFVWAMWTKVIITSNAEPCQWYKRGLTPALERRINSIIHL